MKFMPIQMQWSKSLAGGRHRLLLWSRASKLSILLLLVGVSALVGFAHLPTRFWSGNFDLDQSWFLDLGYHLQEGQLVGRDTLFTYGRLAQGRVSTAGFWQGSGSILNALWLSRFLFTTLGPVLLALCLGLIRQIRWAGALFIFLVSFSLNLLNLLTPRPLLVLLGVILLWRALRSVSFRRRGWAVGAGGLWFIGLLFSMDTGFFALASALGLL